MLAIPLVKRLEEQLKNIEVLVLSLIASSTIEKEQPDPFEESLIVALVNSYYWSEDNDDQKRLQIKTLRTYSAWFEHFTLLFHGSPQETQRRISETDSLLRQWIEKKDGWNVPRSIDEALKRIHEDFEAYYQLFLIM